MLGPVHFCQLACGCLWAGHRSGAVRWEALVPSRALAGGRPSTALLSVAPQALEGLSSSVWSLNVWSLVPCAFPPSVPEAMNCLFSFPCDSEG